MTIRIPRRWWAADSPAPARDIFAALALKFVMLLAIYLLYFGPPHQPRTDAGMTAAALVGAPPQGPQP